MKIDKDDDRYEPTITQSSFSPKQERKYIGDFTYFQDNYIKVDVTGYVDSLVKDIDEEIERQLAEAGFIKVVRCKDCKHYIKSDAEHPDCDFCKRLICGVIRPDFFCADGERRDDDDTDTN